MNARNRRAAHAALLVLSLTVATAVRAASSGGHAPVAVPDADAANPAAVKPDAGSGTAAELMRLQEDTVVLKARLKKLDAQALVAERAAALDRMDGSTRDGEMLADSTESFGQTMLATLELADGRQVDVRIGDTVPGGARVVAIRPGVVVLEGRSGDRRELRVSTPSPAVRSAWQSTLPAGVPPLPPLPLSR